MIAYDQSFGHDMLLLGWWSRMFHNADLDRTFTQDLHAPGAFMACWRAGNRALVFDHDDEGIWIAIWFQPVMSGAYMGIWVRPDQRLTKRRTVEAVKTTLVTALGHWEPILSLTKQEKLLRPLRGLGYDVVGRVPGLWDGEAVWVAALTHEGLKRGRKERLAS